MVLKKRISYQWRIFLPIIICLWIVIFGMFRWHVSRVKSIRDEMAYDQMAVIGSRIVNFYEMGDTSRIKPFSEYISKFYEESDNYDPMEIWIEDIPTGKILARYGNLISPAFTEVPNDKKGRIWISKDYLDYSENDIRFLYTTHISPINKRRIHVMLPYTRRLQEVIDSNSTYFWLIFVTLGIIVTIITYISANYFNRNLRILKNFAYQASHNPNFVINDKQQFPHDELGEISHEIMNIYNQRIQEVNKSEREHKVALNAIVEKERIKKELTGNINHELKTPVGVIQGYLDTIIGNPDLDPATRDRFLLKAQQNVHRLTQLINDITAITKLESGGKLINITEVDFHDLIFAFESFLQEGNVLQGKMTFSYQLPLNCKVSGNEQLLHTVVLNFVKNSVNYSEGTECHLLMTKEDDDFYYFKYYDNGVGVPPEHLPHMFERFYRVNAGRSRNAGGTGLGLAIVEVTIESFGGKIEVMNHFPTGLEYNFSLPKYKKPAKPAESDEGSDNGESSDKS